MLIMYKTFYSSGFLYNPTSQQILLQQPQPLTSMWVLFEKEHKEHEHPEEVFRNHVLKLLGIEIDIIYPIYSYLNETTKNNRSLFYAITEDLTEIFSKNDYNFRWFSFKDVLKIQATEQTKHDIVVGQRVIQASDRKSRGEHTFQ